MTSNTPYIVGAGVGALAFVYYLNRAPGVASSGASTAPAPVPRGGTDATSPASVPLRVLGDAWLPSHHHHHSGVSTVPPNPFRKPKRPQDQSHDPFVTGRLYHQPGLAPKGLENSRAGVRQAVANGDQRIDFDVSRTKDGHLVAYHPGTIRGVMVQDLTLAELQKLRTPGGHHIWLASDLTNYATAHRIKVELEAKVPNLTVAELTHLRSQLTHPHMTQWKALPKNVRSLNAASRSGWDGATILLARGGTFSRRLWDYVAFVRGKVHWKP